MESEVELHQKYPGLALDSLYHNAQAGIWMFAQAGSPTVAACRDRLGETPSLQSHHQLPAQFSLRQTFCNESSLWTSQIKPE